MASIPPAEEIRAGQGPRLCRNYETRDVCNWSVAADDPHPLCRSCRLTHVIPDISDPAHLTLWHRLEVAKRRLIVTLLALNLPIVDRERDPQNGLAFEFRADSSDPGEPRVMTGHASGIITINIAEADDAERERRRHDMGEPYRTLLGHFRHESGHYYWDRLIRDSERVDEFRALFGDERLDYQAALHTHYESGPPDDWASRFVTSYASAHPWEDWAETWAHYLHMLDTLETAADSGLRLQPWRADDPVLEPMAPTLPFARAPFERLLERWFPLTYILNNLNRGLGLPDAYPFVLSDPAVEKLRFVHQVATNVSAASSNEAMVPARL